MSFVSRIIEDITAGVEAHIDPQRQKPAGYFTRKAQRYFDEFIAGKGQRYAVRRETGEGPLAAARVGFTRRGKRRSGQSGGRRAGEGTSNKPTKPTPAKSTSTTPTKPASTKPAKPSRVRKPRKPRLVKADEKPEKKDEPQRIAASYKDLANKLLDVINDAN